MTTLLHISASPRGEQSAALAAAQVVTSTLPTTVTVDHIDLFGIDLPETTVPFTNAKQKAFTGAALTEDEAAIWAQVAALN